MKKFLGLIEYSDHNFTVVKNLSDNYKPVIFISKKVIKKSKDRNYIKRRVRNELTGKGILSKVIFFKRGCMNLKREELVVLISQLSENLLSKGT